MKFGARFGILNGPEKYGLHLKIYVLSLLLCQLQIFKLIIEFENKINPQFMDHKVIIYKCNIRVYLKSGFYVHITSCSLDVCYTQNIIWFCYVCWIRVEISAKIHIKLILRTCCKFVLKFFFANCREMEISDFWT